MGLRRFESLSIRFMKDKKIGRCLPIFVFIFCYLGASLVQSESKSINFYQLLSFLEKHGWLNHRECEGLKWIERCAKS
mgnify:CR=1 FL=1